LEYYICFLRAKLVAKSVKTTKLLNLVLSKFKTFVSQGKSKKVQIFLKGSYRMLLTIMSFYWALPIATFWSSSWEPEAEGAFKVAPFYLFEKHEFF